MKYELLFLVGQNKEAQLPEIEDAIIKILTESEGKLSEERWEEKRKLAYPVDKILRGTYVARRFETADQDYWGEENVNKQKNPIAEITRRLNLFSDILRFTIVRVDGMLSLRDFAIKKAEEKEMGQQRFQKTEKTDRETTIRFRKEMIRTVKPIIDHKPLTPKDVAQEEKPETKLTEKKEPMEQPVVKKDSEKSEKAPVSSASAADIDKKLDEILNM